MWSITWAFCVTFVGYSPVLASVGRSGAFHASRSSLGVEPHGDILVVPQESESHNILSMLVGSHVNDDMDDDKMMDLEEALVDEDEDDDNEDDHDEDEDDDDDDDGDEDNEELDDVYIENASPDEHERNVGQEQFGDFRQAWEEEDGEGEQFYIEDRLLAERCFVSHGGDVLEESSKLMTLLEARDLCLATSDCQAVTALRPPTHAPGQPLEFYFKNRSSCQAADDWITLPVYRDDGFSPATPKMLRRYPNATVLSENPLIIQYDDFLSAEEVAHFIQLATPILQRSTTGMEREFDETRSSSTAWVHDSEDSMLIAIEERIANLTGVPARNHEDFQVLRYNVGQEYKVHHDLILEQRRQPCGARVATFYMYLSDVQRGGGTEFPELNLTVQPVRGRALLWWDVDILAYHAGTPIEHLDEDSRVEHGALPVLEGVKWGVNKWLHERDFSTNYRLRRLS